MDKKSRNTIIISIVALAIILITVTYAYFSARITGIESASTISLTAGHMGIVYTEGNEILSFSNIYPREEAWVTKTFTLTGYNTTELDMKYDLGLNVETNTFPDDYLTYDLRLVSSTNGTPIATTTGNPINGTGNIKFGTGIFTNANGDTHNYELKIYFKDSGEDQNNAQQAVFNAKIYIEEGFIGPNGWKTALPGTLLSGIKSSGGTVHNDSDTGMTIPGQQISSTSEGLRSTEDDYGTSYYYRGAIDNNYIVFANMCWRIVRVDGAGNIKLVLYNYNPNNVSNPCATSEDGETRAFARLVANNSNSYKVAFNSSGNRNTYIGYMYSNNPDSSDYATAHANDVDSTILTNLKSWYDRVFSSGQKGQLADVIWCNDKRVVSDTTYDAGGIYGIVGTGLGTDKTYYQTSQRLYPYNSTTSSYGTFGAAPSLKCGSSINDNKISKFTANDTVYGNGALNGYKIGLLTADEIAFAGASRNRDNASYYLYKNANEGQYNYWTLSPYDFNSIAYVHILKGFTNGVSIYVEGVYYSNNNAVRPAIALKPDVNISGGNGTASNPFVVF